MSMIMIQDLSFKAYIIRSSKRSFVCLDQERNMLFQASSLGNLLKFGEIVVGDQVLVKKENNDWTIIELLPRKNEIFRYIQRNQKRKIMASNCDALIILISASKPIYKKGLIDRFLIRSYQWDITPYIVFNKMDEYDPTDFDIKKACQRIEHLCPNIYEISAKDPSYTNKYGLQSFNQLKNDLENKTCLFLGASGVGKSKTISTLTQGNIILKDQNLGKAGKGQHTTSWSEIVYYKNYRFIDSPGIRSFSLDDIQQKDLINFFPDVQKISLQCQFTNCQHNESIKGCAFTQLSENNIIKDRLESFKNIFKELS